MNKQSLSTMKQRNECRVRIPGNQWLIFESYQDNALGTEYVRVENDAGKELVYWDHIEWSESLEQAQEVMGAIMACIQSGAQVRIGTRS